MYRFKQNVFDKTVLDSVIQACVLISQSAHSLEPHALTPLTRTNGSPVCKAVATKDQARHGLGLNREQPNCQSQSRSKILRPKSKFHTYNRILRQGSRLRPRTCTEYDVCATIHRISALSSIQIFRLCGASGSIP